MTDDALRYYRVSPRIWSVPRWSESARLLALYLLTCPHRTVEGLFRLPKAYIQADLEWSPQRLAEPFHELIADGFIEYDDDTQVVLITKALKYQAPANPNGVKAALRKLEEAPESPLDQRFYQLAERYSQRLAEGLPERFRQPLAQPPTPTPAPALREMSPPGDAHPTPDFDDFWGTYPRHHSSGKPGGGASKAKTIQRWKQLTPEDRATAIQGARHYAAWCRTPHADYPAHATTWLNERRFEDWQTPASATNGHRSHADRPRGTVGGVVG